MKATMLGCRQLLKSVSKPLLERLYCSYLLQDSYFSLDENLFHRVLEATWRADLFHGNVNAKEVGFVHRAKRSYVTASESARTH